MDNCMVCCCGRSSSVRNRTNIHRLSQSGVSRKCVIFALPGFRRASKRETRYATVAAKRSHVLGNHWMLSDFSILDSAIMPQSDPDCNIVHHRPLVEMWILSRPTSRIHRLHLPDAVRKFPSQMPSNPSNPDSVPITSNFPSRRGVGSVSRSGFEQNDTKSDGHNTELKSRFSDLHGILLWHRERE